MDSANGPTKRETVRFVLAILLPVPVVFWWGQVRPDTLEGAALLGAGALGATVMTCSWLLAGWIVGRIDWRDSSPGEPPSDLPSS